MVLDREKHVEEYCAMYDICGQRIDGKVLNCPYGTPSVEVCSSHLARFLIIHVLHSVLLLNHDGTFAA